MLLTTDHIRARAALARMISIGHQVRIVLIRISKWILECL